MQETEDLNNTINQINLIEIPESCNTLNIRIYNFFQMYMEYSLKPCGLPGVGKPFLPTKYCNYKKD